MSGDRANRRAEEGEGGGYHARLKRAKQQAALEAALRVFLEQGYANATLQQIAAAAKISTSTLFKHFATKAAIFEAMVMEVWSPGAGPSSAPQTKDVETGLLELGRDIADRICSERNIAFYRIFIAAVPAFPELGSMMYERGKLAYIKRVRSFLNECTYTSKPPPKVIEAVSSQLLGMITDRVFWPCILVPSLTISNEERQDAVTEAVATVLARMKDC